MWCLLALIVGLGAWLRGWRLSAKSLWLGEALAVASARRPWGETLFAPRQGDPQPPLYPATLRLWLGGSRGASRARALSAAASAATVVVLYALARLLLPRWAALVAAGLAAASSCGVYFAQEARLPAVAGLLVAVSWYLLAELVAGRRLERWPMWLGLAACNTAALYTSCHTVFAVVAQLLALVLVWREVGRRLVVPWAVWQLVPLTAFGFYVPVFVERSGSGPGVGGGSPGSVAREAARLLGGGLPYELSGRLAAAAGVAAVVAAALVALVGLAGARRHWAATALGRSWLAAPLVGLMALPAALRGGAFGADHVAYAAPALGLLAAVGLSALRGKARALPIAVAALVLGLNAASLARYYDRRAQKEDWRGAAAWMTQLVEPGDIVCLDPPSLQAPFDHYYRGPAVLRRAAPATGGPLPSGDLALERRTWLVAHHAAAAGTGREAPAALRRYPLLAKRSFPGLLGTVELRLLDTRHPPLRPEPEG